MKKISFDIKVLSGLYNLEIGKGGLDEALWDISVDWCIGDNTSEYSYSFNDCFKIAQDKFKKDLSINYVPSQYIEQLKEDTLQAMRDSESSDYENKVFKRIIEHCIDTVRVNAPCEVSKVYFVDYNGNKCTGYEAYEVIAEVTEAAARKFIGEVKGEYTYNEWGEYYDVEDELGEAWEVEILSWEYWDEYGDQEKYFIDCFDSEAIWEAKQDKAKHEAKLKQKIKNSAPLYSRVALFGEVMA